jgi:hypothetical protein
LGGLEEGYFLKEVEEFDRQSKNPIPKFVFVKREQKDDFQDFSTYCTFRWLCFPGSSCESKRERYMYLPLPFPIHNIEGEEPDRSTSNST